MACNVCFMEPPLGSIDIIPPGARCVNVTVSGTSAASSITANAGELARVATDTACYYMVASSVTAGQGIYLHAGGVEVIGPLRQGDVVSVVAA